MSVIGSFVTAGDVDARKQSLAKQIRGWDTAVQSKASTLNPGVLASWNAWRDGTLAFLDKPTGFWTAGDENDQTISDEKEFDDWRAQLAPLLGVPTPPIVRPPEPAPGVTSGVDSGTKLLIGVGLVAIVVVALRR